MVYFNHVAQLCFIKLHLIQNIALYSVAYTLCSFHTRILSYLLTCVTAGIANFCNSALKKEKKKSSILAQVMHICSAGRIQKDV